MPVGKPAPAAAARRARRRPRPSNPPPARSPPSRAHPGPPPVPAKPGEPVNPALPGDARQARGEARRCGEARCHPAGTRRGCGERRPAPPGKPAAVPAAAGATPAPPAKPPAVAPPRPALPGRAPGAPVPRARRGAERVPGHGACYPRPRRLRETGPPARDRRDGLPSPLYRAHRGRRHRDRWRRGVRRLSAGLVTTSGGSSQDERQQADNGQDPAAPVNPSTVTVSVLNGTTVPASPPRSATRSSARRFQRGNVTNSAQQRTASAVLFARCEGEARLVARQLRSPR